MLLILKADPHLMVSGVFRPPVNGVYSLTVYGIVANDDGGNIMIKKDDTMVCSAWLQYNTIHSTAMCTATAQLVEGDSVKVTGTSSDPSVLDAPNSGFVGFLIFET